VARARNKAAGSGQDEVGRISVMIQRRSVSQMFVRYGSLWNGAFGGGVTDGLMSTVSRRRWKNGSACSAKDVDQVDNRARVSVVAPMNMIEE